MSRLMGMTLLIQTISKFQNLVPASVTPSVPVMPPTQVPPEPVLVKAISNKPKNLFTSSNNKNSPPIIKIALIIQLMVVMMMRIFDNI